MRNVLHSKFRDNLEAITEKNLKKKKIYSVNGLTEMSSITSLILILHKELDP